LVEAVLNQLRALARRQVASRNAHLSPHKFGRLDTAAKILRSSIEFSRRFFKGARLDRGLGARASWVALESSKQPSNKLYN
jgi:hypothetical protein